MATSTQVLTLERIVEVGVDWLLRSEQPDDAWMQHHGAYAPVVDNLRLCFVPTGYSPTNGHGPVLVVDRAHWAYIDDAGNVDNPLTEADMARVVDALGAVNVSVASSWNGPPAITGSFALDAGSSPSLVAAVSRYHTGCPDHGSVFCGWQGSTPETSACDWYARGYAKIVQPVWSAS